MSSVRVDLWEWSLAKSWGWKYTDVLSIHSAYEVMWPNESTWEEGADGEEPWGASPFSFRRRRRSQQGRLRSGQEVGRKLKEYITVLCKHISQEKEVFQKAVSCQLCWKVKCRWKVRPGEDWKASIGFGDPENAGDPDETDFWGGQGQRCVIKSEGKAGGGQVALGLFSLDCTFLTTGVARKEGKERPDCFSR